MSYKFYGGPLDGQQLEVDDHLNEFIYREQFDVEGGYGYRRKIYGKAQGYYKEAFYRLGDRLDEENFFVFRHESLTVSELEKLVNV